MSDKSSAMQHPLAVYLFHITYSAVWLKRDASKDLSRVKPGFKSVPLKFYFEIAGLVSAKKWREIQNLAGEERF